MEAGRFFNSKVCLTNFLVIKAFLGEVVNKFVKLIFITQSYRTMNLYVQPVLGRTVHYFGITDDHRKDSRPLAEFIFARQLSPG